LGDISLCTAVYANYCFELIDLAFSQMTDPWKAIFPWIRVFGTLGWIVAGVTIGQLDIEKTATTFI
jgi:hypothetical protein